MWKLRLLVRLPFAFGMVLLNVLLTLIGYGLLAITPARSLGDTDLPKYRRWKWDWVNSLWGNYEDGIDGLASPGKNVNWEATTRQWSQFRRQWVWSAWRNSVNNLRYTRIGQSVDYGPSGQPDTGRFVFVSNGIKFWICYPFRKGEWEFWLGWKPIRYPASRISDGFKSRITKVSSPGA